VGVFAGRCPAPTRERCEALPCTCKGAMRGSASRTARKLFEKSFLDLQKLLKMGITKPRPSGEVAAVGLTERAIICKERCEALPCTCNGAMRGSASRTAKKLFEKSFLDLQKLLKMGVVFPRSHDEFTFPPLRRCAVFVFPPPRRLCRLPRKTPS